MALDQIQKLQKMRKKSLWSKNDLYRNKTADINVMQLSMIKFISWQALKMGQKPYYLAPTLWILYRRYSKELFNRSFLAFLRIVQTKSILFLKSMSERFGSDKERI